MTGYAGIGNIIDFTNSYTNNYNSLQMQLNRRFGHAAVERQLHVLTDDRLQQRQQHDAVQFVNANLTKNVVNRPHAINFNFGYDIPDVSRSMS